MAPFVLRRLALAALTVALVVSLTFTLAHLAPGAPMLGDAEQRHADPALIARQRAQFGLDRPLTAQYVIYARNALRGSLGESFARRRPVAALLREHLPNTLLLGGLALLLSLAGGVAAGTLQAARRGTALDRAVGIATLVFYSTPVFWLGLMLLVLFGQWLHWLPVGGMTDPVLHDRLSAAGRAADVLRHTLLPALTLALVNMAAVARFHRSAMVDVLATDWVRAARARGLGRARVLVRHGVRSALGPVVTLAGLSVPVLLTGSVLVESVFGWPGVGRLMHEAILARDYNVITGIAFVGGVLVALANLAADLGAAALDPRVRA